MALLQQDPASKKKSENELLFFKIKKDTGLRAFSSRGISTDLPTEGSVALRFGAWAWRERRREVGVSEVSGVKSGALFSTAARCIRAFSLTGASEAGFATRWSCYVTTTPSPISLQSRFL